MNASIITFRTGIGNLRRHVETLNMEWKLIATSVPIPTGSVRETLVKGLQDCVGNGSVKKQFDYCSIVISLYGLLEQFVESLARGYCQQINAIVPKYSKISECVQKSHVDLSMVLMNRAGHARYRGEMKPCDLIANLHSCMSDSVPYKINADAFCYHTANFRHDTIDETLAKLGVQGATQRIRLVAPFSEYLEQAFVDRQPSSIKSEEVYYYLDDLAERRNEVAHGNVSELLSNEILLEYIRYIECLCESLHRLVDGHVAELLVKHKSVSLGKPITVFDHSIVCLELKNIQIKVGDILAAATGNNQRPYVASEIHEIQVDRQSMKVVVPASSVKVGVKVKYKAKDNYDYFLVPK